MENVSNENTFSGYLIDNPLYFTGIDDKGVDTYQLPTSSNEREDRDREEELAKQLRLPKVIQSNAQEEGILEKMQTLEVSADGEAQSKSSVPARPLLLRPSSERVVFNQTGSSTPFAFTTQAGQSLEGTDWDQESVYEEPNELPLTDESARVEYVGPCHNPAEINAFFQLRAGELLGLADPQTLDALPEQELFALISVAMASLRRRRSVFL